MPKDLETLTGLDPDDPRPPSHQIANVLRAAIRTHKFAPGEKLPSQTDLASRYQVARETIKAALRILRDERLIVTRQGSGAFVRAQTERPVGLRPHVEEAFNRPHVTVDFAGFSGETLHGVLSEPIDKIRAGRLTPEALSIRMLLPDPDAPLALPVRVESLEDDQELRKRHARITRRHTEAIVEAVHELSDLGLVKNATAEVRVHRAAPSFKLYILNGEEAFFSFYPVVEHTVKLNNESVAIYDLMGKDSILFHYALTDDETSNSPQYVAESVRWFDSMWSTVARESAP